ncbi:hypothetical protein [Kribbella sp. NPDC050470]|uniref:hypothetical protein n=1 Tax=unclassified Kribbella TaxID=2644121 RepID=UPI0037A57723
MALVFANCTTWIADGHLIQDEAWDADDPIVKARPDLFSDEPSVVRGVRKPAAPVETATAEPGEKRTRTRRA